MKRRRPTRWFLPVSLVTAVSLGLVAGTTVFLGQGSSGSQGSTRSPVVGGSPSSAGRANSAADHPARSVDPVQPPIPSQEPPEFVAAQMAAPLILARHAIPAADPGFDQFTRLRHTEVAEAASPDAVHPMFNARSCAECHRQGGIGGGGPNENNVRLFNKAFARRDLKLQAHFGHGLGVAVLHRRSSAPEYVEWRLALIEKFAPHDAEVAQRIKLRIGNFVAIGAPAAGLFCACAINGASPSFEQRNTPPLFGLGLIESIPQSDIDAVAASQPKELQGRSPRLQGGGRGRFGWKSSTATLGAFNENACAVELGLKTSRFTPATFRPATFRTSPPDAPALTPARPTAGVVNNSVASDMSDADLAALNRYVANLPAPRQIVDPSRQGQIAEGARHFDAIGCAKCHQPNLGGVTGLYSDLLLHSVGTSGGGFYGNPTTTPNGKQPDFDIVRADEFRTPPLWGVADSAPYLHNGSAPTLEAAILRHHGQASPANTAYQSKLTSRERESLIAFLDSLRVR